MKNNILILFLIFLLVFMVSCSTISNVSSLGEDKNVISAVLLQLCSKSRHDRFYFLNSETDIVEPSFVSDRIENSMRHSLVDRNRVPASLPMVSSCEGLRRIDAKQLDSYLGAAHEKGVPERWMKLYENHEGLEGVISLSLPGYSSQGDFAVVQISSSCGWLCGGGSFWILKKVFGRWQVDTSKQMPGWQS